MAPLPGQEYFPGSWGTAPRGRPGQTSGTPGRVLPAQTRRAAIHRRNGTRRKKMDIISKGIFGFHGYPARFIKFIVSYYN